VGYAYPVGTIMIDGNFTDWPQDIITYKIGVKRFGYKTAE
jgi:hypothetical protein